MKRILECENAEIDCHKRKKNEDETRPDSKEMCLLDLPSDVLRDFLTFCSITERITLHHTCRSLRGLLPPTTQVISSANSKMNVVRPHDDVIRFFYWEIFLWLTETRKYDQGVDEDDSLCTLAAEYGRLQMLKILVPRRLRALDRKMDHEGPLRESFYDVIVEKAAENGHLEIIKWIKAQGYWKFKITCEVPAVRGHLETVKWLYDQDLPLAQGFGSEFLCDSATYSGNLELVEWAFERGGASVNACLNAAEKGHLHVLKWLHDKSVPVFAWRICYNAACHGHLEVLKWLRSKECTWNVEVCVGAAEQKDVEVLRWLLSNGCPWDERVCSAAARKGNLEMLKIAREEGCEWNSETCNRAAWAGHWDILKWARLHGCPCDELTTMAVAEMGNLEMLKLLIEQGCPWTKECFKIAMSYDCPNKTEVLKYLQEGNFLS